MMKRFSSFMGIAAIACLLSSAAMAKPAKVDVCHVPPGNPDNAHSISVSVNAVQAHLDHGDVVCCQGEACTAGGVCTSPGGCFACSCGDTCENLCPPPPVPCGPIDCCAGETCVQDGVCQSGSDCYTCSCGDSCSATPCP